jgi:uncharacterized membrane protein
MQRHTGITGTTFISYADPTSTATPRGQPIHELLAPFAAAYFTGAFVTDLAYWQTADVLWERFSIWLIVAGLVMAGFAIVAGVFDLASGRQINKPILPRALGYALAVLLSLINAFVHSRDGYTAVVPTGLTISGLVVVIVLLMGLMSSTSAYRHHTGADT